MKTAYVFLANGFEDVEAVTPVDYLRRAGVKVSVVSLEGSEVESSHNLTIRCDCTLDDVLNAPLPDLVVLPGGMTGTKNLAASEDLRKFMKKMMDERRFIGAICAAPAVVLGSWGLLDGRTWTGYPGVGSTLTPRPGKERVVVDGHLVTSRAAGCAEEFSLVLIKLLCGPESMRKVADEILAREEEA